MAEQTTAASSPADQDVFGGQDNISFDGFERHRRTGEAATPINPADNAASAPADAPKEVVSESAGESETPEDQQQEKTAKKPLSKSEWRLAQLDTQLDAEYAKPEQDWDKIYKLQSIRDRVVSGVEQKRKTEPAPVVQPPPQAQVQSQPQYTRPKPTMEDKNPDGTLKYTDWDDYNVDVGRWGAQQEIADYQRQQAAQAQAERLNAKVEEARERYGEEFQSVVVPTWDAIWNSKAVPDVIKDIMRESELTPDVVHKLGKDSQASEKFFRMAQANPIDAVKFIGALEESITHELAMKKADTVRNEKGQFVSSEPPARQKTSAPKPPEPVGGATTRAFDVNDESIPTDEWARKRNAAEFKRKGKL